MIYGVDDPLFVSWPQTGLPRPVEAVEPVDDDTPSEEDSEGVPNDG